MFAHMAGVELTHVPYRGSAEALTDLVSGQVRSSFADLLVVLPQTRAGAIRALAVTFARRHHLLPELPTMAEVGLPGFEAASWRGLFAPAGTPPAILERLHAEVAAAMGAAEIRDFLSRQGFLVEATAPADFAAFVAAETTRWAAVVRAANITPD
jgi:tripartite-type tricarboxylate transporter receptor subunit TctC